MSARRFRWELAGTRVFAKVGPLSVEVRAKGRISDGSKRWRAAEAFGAWLGCPWRDSLDVAIQDAEREARRIGCDFIVALVGAGAAS